MMRGVVVWFMVATGLALLGWLLARVSDRGPSRAQPVPARGTADIAANHTETGEHLSLSSPIAPPPEGLVEGQLSGIDEGQHCRLRIRAGNRVLADTRLSRGPFQERFTFSGGPAFVEFSHPGSYPLTFVLREPRTDLGTISLSAGATYGGIIVGPDGAPMADVVAELRVRAEATLSGESAVTGDNGRFEIPLVERLPAPWGGAYELFLEKGDAFSGPHPLVDEGWHGRAVVTAAFQDPVRLRFVDRATRLPLGGVIVRTTQQLSDETAPEYAAGDCISPPSAADGVVVVRWPPWTATIRLIVMHGGTEHVLVLQREEVGGDPHDVLLGDEDAARVRVRAVQQDGASVPNVALEIHTEWTNHVPPRLGRKGRILRDHDAWLRGTTGEDGTATWILNVPRDAHPTVVAREWNATHVDRGQPCADAGIWDAVPACGDGTPLEVVVGRGAATGGARFFGRIRGAGEAAPPLRGQLSFGAHGRERLVAGFACARKPVVFDGGACWRFDINGADASSLDGLEWDDVTMALVTGDGVTERVRIDAEELGKALKGRGVVTIVRAGGDRVLRIGVSRPDGSPAGDAWVTIVPEWARGGAVAMHASRAQTNERGYASLAGVGNERYVIVAVEGSRAAVLRGVLPGDYAMTLEESRALRFTVRTEGGGVPQRPVVAVTTEPPLLAPQPLVKMSDAGEVEVEPFAYGVFMVRIKVHGQPWIVMEPVEVGDTVVLPAVVVPTKK